jgi:hypothetical protein
MIRNINAYRRGRNDFSFESTGDDGRRKKTKENQQGRRILHFVSFSDAG